MIVRRTIPALALLLLACFGPELRAQSFVQTIDPFRVEYGDGTRLMNPFSGGLFQPRIGLADLDGDELPDLLTMNPDNRLRLYRNEGSFRFRRVIPSPYEGIRLSGWFRLVDLNGDGALDLLTSGGTSEILVYTNNGTQSAPSFGVSAALKDAQGIPIRPQQATVPAFADIDADGDLDLFIGNPIGTISFYRNDGSAPAPLFVAVTQSFEGILVISSGGEAKREDAGSTLGALHGASVLDFVDLDGDLDLDILFGDFFTERLIWFHNNGSPQQPRFSMQSLDTAFGPAGDIVGGDRFNQPASADLDRDGDLDVLVSSLAPFTTDHPITLYENTGSATAPIMRYRGADLTDEIDIGSYASPAHYRGWGKEAVLVGSEEGTLTRIDLEREGGTRWRIAGSHPLNGIQQTTPATGDLDGDGNDEVVIGESEGSLRLYRMSSGMQLSRESWNLDTATGLARYISPTLADFDADGDLDLLAGTTGGRFVFFRNIGSRTAALFAREPAPKPFDTLDVGSDAAPRAADLDADGRPDLMIGWRTITSGVTERDSVWFFLNRDGRFERSSAFPSVAVANNPVPIALTLPEGRFLFIGEQSGGLTAHRFGPASSVEETGAENEATATVSPSIVRSGEPHLRVTWSFPTDDAVLTITDLLGNELFRRPFPGRTGRESVELPSLPEGFYLARIHDGERGVTVRLVVLR